MIEVIADGKSLIPYEKKITTDNLDLKPENGTVLKKIEFYSYLKQKVVTDEGYENSKFLYTTLQMINLSDMNDL